MQRDPHLIKLLKIIKILLLGAIPILNINFKFTSMFHVYFSRNNISENSNLLLTFVTFQSDAVTAKTQYLDDNFNKCIGVNLMNILHVCFSCESVFFTTILSLKTKCNYKKLRNYLLYKKRSRKMLMKWTQGVLRVKLQVG